MKKKSRITTLLLILILVIGLSLLLYPTVSEQWNKRHSTQAITVYEQALQDSGGEEREKQLLLAEEYNRDLAQTGLVWNPGEAQLARYNSTLNFIGDGMMGYIEIEKISCRLPIYHGTSEGVLQTGVGHLEGSSLPVGGESTHCMLSGHRGLPSARLFTDLAELEEGDRFVLRVLDTVLTYEVDQIRTVLPNELDALQIEPGEDLCTLITCTPYGINSHRLLVRGRRVENDEQSEIIRVSGDALPIDPLIVAPIVAAPSLLVILALVLCSDVRKKRRASALSRKETGDESQSTD